MESLVPTLETCKQLKAAGFQQEAAFYWLKEARQPWEVGTQKYRSSNRYAAPTAQEMSDQLPRWIDERDGIWPLEVRAKGLTEKVWYAQYSRFTVFAKHQVEGDTMAEALALLWLKLQEAK